MKRLPEMRTPAKRHGQTRRPDPAASEVCPARLRLSEPAPAARDGRHRRALSKRLGASVMLGPLAACMLNLLSACMAQTPGTAAGHAPAVGRPEDARRAGADAPVRIGASGGSLAADRGIGGTGSPTAEPGSGRTADRGIGGTGIVGIITGFGSIFVNGIEVEIDPSAVVDLDGTASSASVLGTGQLVAIQADGPANAPRARSISVQSAVTGRIDSLQVGPAILTIAGQVVSVPEAAWGAGRFAGGDWVRVSGLRQDDGTVLASRLDPAPPGAFSVRGPVVRDGAVTRVGNLALDESQAAGVKQGQFVIVSGSDGASGRQVRDVAPDTLFPDPAGYFGPAANRLIVQAFVRVDRDTVLMNGMRIKAEPVVAGASGQAGIAVVSLERGQSGAFVVVGLRYPDGSGLTGKAFRGDRSGGENGPPPVPNRSGNDSMAPSAQIVDGGGGSGAAGRMATASAALERPARSAGAMGTAASPATADPSASADPIHGTAGNVALSMGMPRDAGGMNAGATVSAGLAGEAVQATSPAPQPVPAARPSASPAAQSASLPHPTPSAATLAPDLQSRAPDAGFNVPTEQPGLPVAQPDAPPGQTMPWSPQPMPPQPMPPQSMSPQSMPPQPMSPQSMSPQSMSPQSMPPQPMPPTLRSVAPVVRSSPPPPTDPLPRSPPPPPGTSAAQSSSTIAQPTTPGAGTPIPPAAVPSTSLLMSGRTRGDSARLPFAERPAPRDLPQGHQHSHYAGLRPKGTISPPPVGSLMTGAVTSITTTEGGAAPSRPGAATAPPATAVAPDPAGLGPVPHSRTSR
ncbi:MAG TPA: DUF5666 domain-containing protein [Rhodopila sp.]